MDAIEIFREAKEGNKRYFRIIRLLKQVREDLITPEEAVEIFQNKEDVVVLENQP